MLFQVAIQASGCSEMSAEELNYILMGLRCGANQLMGYWEFVAAAVSPVKMRTKGCFLQVCGLMAGFSKHAAYSICRCAHLMPDRCKYARALVTECRIDTCC